MVPDLPSLEQSGYKGSASELWWGVLAAAGTPQPIVDRLNAEINKIVLSPEMKDFFLKEGAEPATLKPAEFEALIASDIERWKKVAKAADIKPGMRVLEPSGDLIDAAVSFCLHGLLGRPASR